jgi:hypothetical protein
MVGRQGVLVVSRFISSTFILPNCALVELAFNESMDAGNANEKKYRNQGILFSVIQYPDQVDQT